MKSLKEKAMEAIKDKMGKDVTIVDKEGYINFNCDGCRDGSSKCCTNRGISDAIIIGPYDIYKMQKALNMDSEKTITKYTVPITGQDSGIPLLVLGERETLSGDKICHFLKTKTIDGIKRKLCSIHESKPGVCQIFPLGRFSVKGENEILYVLQATQCGAPGDHKISIRDWAPDIDNSEKAFKANATVLNEFYKIINFSKFRESSKITLEEKMEFIKDYLRAFYIFDSNRDFFEQFEENKNKTLELLKETVKKYKSRDGKIVPKNK